MYPFFIRAVRPDDGRLFLAETCNLIRTECNVVLTECDIYLY
jgi:hypothetical protein